MSKNLGEYYGQADSMDEVIEIHGDRMPLEKASELRLVDVKKTSDGFRYKKLTGRE